MNILIGDYKGGWDKLGFDHSKYYNVLGHNANIIEMTEETKWSDFRILPFYVPIKRKYGYWNTDFFFQFDGPGNYHARNIKKCGVKALWSCDIQRSDKQKFHKFIQKDFDIIFVAQKDYMPIFNDKPHYWLPYACDPQVYKKYNLKKEINISFAGKLHYKQYKERENLFKILSINCGAVGIEGTYGNDVSKIYSKSKIVFNKSAAGDLNLRVFDVLSTGTMLLTDRIGNGLEDIFTNGKHLVLYDNEKDMLEKAEYYLAHNEEREKIAKAGFEEVISKHTFYHRAKQVMNIVSKFKRGL